MPFDGVASEPPHSFTAEREAVHAGGSHATSASTTSPPLPDSSLQNASQETIRPSPAAGDASIIPQRRPISVSNPTKPGSSPVPLSSSPPKRQSYTPNVSSPLNPRPSPDDSLKSRTSADDAVASASEQSKRPSLIDFGESSASGSRSPPVLPPSRRSYSGMLKVPSSSQISLQRDRSPVGTPMTVRELGSDYTRYYNPFGDSRQSSFTDLTKSGAQTPLTRGNSGARLSAMMNPFETVTERSARSSTDLAGAERRGLLASTTSLPTHSFLDDRLTSSPYLLDKNGPYGYPMYTDEKEDDDDMHMPMADDDLRFKPHLRDHFNRTNICSTLGLIGMVIGILIIFIVFPVLTNAGIVNFTWAYETPIDQMPKIDQIEPWAIVNDLQYPLMQNIRFGLVDKDTPQDAYTRKSYDGSTLNLVFSDEFNDPNRTFYEGDDPFWFAGDFWYGATQDLEWYDPDAVTTWDGTLELRLDAFNNHNLKFRSGMLNSWNHLCFKGGVFEVSVSLPGPAGKMGLWPGAWTMGNLGRPGYLSTTDGMWPYTYNECDAGITPNQSAPDGISRLPGQRLPACTCDGEDHPTPGTGRGAPEIDILEASASYQVDDLGVITQSFQVAPFDIFYYPDYDYMSFPVQNLSYTNTYTGGPYQQAVSGTTTLNNDWYDGIAYQKYAFDYRPGTGSDGWITWYIGDEVMFSMDGRAIRANGNVGPRQVSEEPMSMVLNLGFSNNWVAIDWANMKFPTVMRVDYVRIYQPEGETMITCDPPGYETTQYIADHPEAYNNPNYTHWDEAGYSWPKHKLNTDNCGA